MVYNIRLENDLRTVPSLMYRRLAVYVGVTSLSYVYGSIDEKMHCVDS